MPWKTAVQYNAKFSLCDGFENNKQGIEIVFFKNIKPATKMFSWCSPTFKNKKKKQKKNLFAIYFFDSSKLLRMICWKNNSYFV